MNMTKLSSVCKIAMLICMCFILSSTVPVLAATPDFAVVSGMPDIGKWMLQSDGITPANWLGQRYQGKEIQEPINVIIIDAFAKSAEDAKARLMSATATAGYKSRTGHSTGYKGYIGGNIYSQLPTEANHAFSTTFFWLNNSHGRAFGPHLYNGKYYFTAAMSKEVIGMSNPMHKYDSFMTARNDFGTKMVSKAGYRKLEYVNLQNKISDTDPAKTTGDHNGMAVVLEATK